MKIFDLYEISEVRVEDPCLRKYINLNARMIVKSHGRDTERFGKTKVNIVERLINTLGTPGHRGKKHKIMTHHAQGKWNKNAKTVLNAFKIIQEKTQQNPIQILIKAIENAAPRDEITTIEYGGARYPQAVDVAPLRRISLALKNIIHGSQDRAFNKKASITETLANELIAASENSSESFAVQKRNEAEKMADSAR